jgi:hypothetical protein
MGVLSLNHDITTLLRLSHSPTIQKSTADLSRRNSVRMYPYAHAKYIKVLTHFVYGCCGAQSEASCSLIDDTPTSFGLAHITPILQILASTAQIFQRKRLLEPKMAGTYVRYPYLGLHEYRVLSEKLFQLLASSLPRNRMIPVTHIYHGFLRGVIFLDHS